MYSIYSVCSVGGAVNDTAALWEWIYSRSKQRTRRKDEKENNNHNKALMMSGPTESSASQNQALHAERPGKM